MGLVAVVVGVVGVLDNSQYGGKAIRWLGNSYTALPGKSRKPIPATETLNGQRRLRAEPPADDGLVSVRRAHTYVESRHIFLAMKAMKYNAPACLSKTLTRK